MRLLGIYYHSPLVGAGPNEKTIGTKTTEIPVEYQKSHICSDLAAIAEACELGVL